MKGGGNPPLAIGNSSMKILFTLIFCQSFVLTWSNQGFMIGYQQDNRVPGHGFIKYGVDNVKFKLQQVFGVLYKTVMKDFY